MTLEDEFVLGELVRCIIEQMKLEKDEEEDPFEQYKAILKLKLLSEEGRIRQRVIDGYKAIIEKL